MNFSLIKEVGNGSFGKVFLAMNNLTGALTAVKQLSILGEKFDPQTVRKPCTFRYQQRIFS
jgi:serine/threonine protein kinase